MKPKNHQSRGAISEIWMIAMKKKKEAEKLKKGGHFSEFRPDQWGF